HARLEQVGDPQAFGTGLQVVLDRRLLGPVHDVLDHRTGVQGLEADDFLVTGGVGDFQEAVLLRLRVHPLDHPLDHRVDGRGGRTAVLCKVVRVQRQVGGDVLGEDVPGCFSVGPLDLDLDVQTSRAQDRRVDHVFTVGRADHDDVLESFNTVDLAEQLRDDGVLDVAGH